MTLQRNHSWSVGILLTGCVLVGAVYACVWYATPDRPVARDWPVYMPMLLGPYLLASLGCLLCPTRLVRVLAVLTVVAGLLMAGVAVFDAWPVFDGKPAPGMPASTLASALLLMVQYGTGVLATVGGFVARGAVTR